MPSSTSLVPVKVIENPPFSVEIYYREVTPGDFLGDAYHEGEAASYERLGFHELGRTTRRTIIPLGKLLSKDDLSVWIWRYPTVYVRSGRHIPQYREDQGQKRLRQDYGLFSSLRWPIPKEVRDIIEATERHFDSLQIWTPEFFPAPRIGPSPILVGHSQGQYWLLARWAEALEPFEDIKARMSSKNGRKATCIRGVKNGFLPPGSIVGLIAGCFGLVSILATHFSTKNLVWLAMEAGFTLLSVSYAVAWDKWLSSERMKRWACETAGWVYDDREM